MAKSSTTFGPGSKRAKAASKNSPWRKWYISPGSKERARRTVEKDGGVWEGDKE
jgi:hypothetical protein